jgi:hypothetical protein
MLPSTKDRRSRYPRGGELSWPSDVPLEARFPSVGPGRQYRGNMAVTQTASGHGRFVRYDESPSERDERVRREVEKARQSFRLTDGQRKTLRKARRAS